MGTPITGTNMNAIAGACTGPTPGAEVKAQDVNDPLTSVENDLTSIRDGNITVHGGWTFDGSDTTSGLNAITATGNVLGGSGGSFAAGGGNAPGSISLGAGNREGAFAQGGATGPGGVFHGGVSSGDGMQSTALAGNANGGTLQGHGSGAGVAATAGATGIGGTFQGGAGGQGVVGAAGLGDVADGGDFTGNATGSGATGTAGSYSVVSVAAPGGGTNVRLTLDTTHGLTTDAQCYVSQTIGGIPLTRFFVTVVNSTQVDVQSSGSVTGTWTGGGAITRAGTPALGAVNGPMKCKMVLASGDDPGGLGLYYANNAIVAAGTIAFAGGTLSLVKGYNVNGVSYGGTYGGVPYLLVSFVPATGGVGGGQPADTGYSVHLTGSSPITAASPAVVFTPYLLHDPDGMSPPDVSTASFAIVVTSTQVASPANVGWPDLTSGSVPKFRINFLVTLGA